MSKEALEVAKRIAYIVWQTIYPDDQLYLDEKLPRNDGVSTEHPDNITFFFGQFDIQNQETFMDIINALPSGKIKIELSDYANNYFKSLN